MLTKTRGAWGEHTSFMYMLCIKWKCTERSMHTLLQTSCSTKPATGGHWPTDAIWARNAWGKISNTCTRYVRRTTQPKIYDSYVGHKFRTQAAPGTMLLKIQRFSVYMLAQSAQKAYLFVPILILMLLFVKNTAFYFLDAPAICSKDSKGMSSVSKYNSDLAK